MATDPDTRGGEKLVLLVSPWELSYSLSSRVGHLPFSNAPFHRTEKGRNELRELLEKVPEPPDERPILYFASPYYSFVPEDLYEEADQHRMLELAFTGSFDPEEIRTERCLVADARVLHWTPSVLREVLTDHYPGFIPHHFTIPAINTLLGLHHRSRKACGLAHIREREVDVGFAVEGTLRILNSFSYANKDELVYFILHTWRSCNEGDEPEHLHITGTTEQGGERELLLRYIEDLTLHEDGKGNWCSFLLQDIEDVADHRRSS